MSLQDKKLLRFDQDYTTLPNRINNRADWLKQYFNGRTAQLAEHLNALIDWLGNSSGSDVAANSIGALNADGGSTTVGAHTSSSANPHKVTAAQVGAYSKSETDQLIADVQLAAGAGDMVSNVYDPMDGDTRPVQDAGGIAAYVDAAIENAITNALNGGV